MIHDWLVAMIDQSTITVVKLLNLTRVIINNQSEHIAQQLVVHGDDLPPMREAIYSHVLLQVLHREQRDLEVRLAVEALLLESIRVPR